MTLNASGPISIAGTTAGQSIQIELGGNGTTAMSLNDSSVRTLAGVPTGAITMPTNFYGKANQFSFSIATPQSNANLRTLAVAAGWNQTSAVVATVNSGVVISSTCTAVAGLTINGTWPNGVQLINNGQIGGKGGRGALGCAGPPFASGPKAGGPAISLGVSATIVNNSYIGGGGGGGAASINTGGGGGAGGGAGGNVGAGSGGNGGNVMPGTGGAGGAGGTATNGSPGTAGGGGGNQGYCNCNLGLSQGGPGGSAGNAGSPYVACTGNSDAAGGGGGWGASGGGGGANSYSAGNAGGKAIALNGFTATRSGAGTTYGAVS